MTKLYYTPPKQTQFEELKSMASRIWGGYDNTYGYVDEKINRIKDLKNIKDNFMYMVAMFDYKNQIKLAGMLSDKTRKAVADRIKDGGTPDNLNFFLEK
jgi:hypothetical protein